MVGRYVVMLAIVRCVEPVLILVDGLFNVVRYGSYSIEPNTA